MNKAPITPMLFISTVAALSIGWFAASVSSVPRIPATAFEQGKEVIPKNGPKKYPTGRVADPKKVAKLRAESVSRWGAMLKALPKVTAASWDCRTLGIVPPVVDQGQCLLPGTKVTMADGSLKNIEDVQRGESVLTKEGTGKVVGLSHRPAREVNRAYDLSEGPIQSRYLWAIEAGGQRVVGTRKHEVYTKHGYIQLQDVGVGELVRFVQGFTLKWEKVTRSGLADYDSSTWLYDLRVHKGSNYFANGICVHNCGSCWDFSGTGVVHSVLVKAGQLKLSDRLSEQYTLDCGRNGGCNGDDNITVLAWAKDKGIPKHADYGAYTAREGQCKGGNYKLWQITDWGFCTTSDQQGVATVQDIKNAMVQFGPIGAAIAADDAFMNNPPGKVFDRTTSTGIDHDIILVGWDDAKGKNGAWILRNSWGDQWCDNGYCYIGYGVNLVGTEAVWAKAQSVVPQTVAVPNVVGDTLGDATAALKTAGLVVGTVTGDTSNKVQSQNPAAGTQVPPGIAVNISFGTPQPPMGTPPFYLYEGDAPNYVQVGHKDGYPTLIGAEADAKAIANKGNVSVGIWDSNKPSSLVETVKPAPPIPPIGGVTITLSADMPAGTYNITPTHSVAITADMTIREVMEAIQRCKEFNQKGKGK